MFSYGSNCKTFDLNTSARFRTKSLKKLCSLKNNVNLLEVLFRISLRTTKGANVDHLYKTMHR